MFRRSLPLLAVLLLLATAWVPVASPTSSDLRGVSAPSEGVAWITGTRGACLVTRDAGHTWRTVRSRAPKRSTSAMLRPSGREKRSS
ncbi:MAG: hypothetical protein ABR610_01120 [Thermoanaerobaculia bacterium]